MRSQATIPAADLPVRTPTDGLLDEYRAWNAIRKKPGSVQPGRNVRVIRRFLWRGGVTDVADIDAAMVERFMADELAGGAAARTVRNHKAAIGSFCRFLRRRGHIAGSPCFDLDLPPLEQHMAPTIEESAIGPLLESARRHGLYPAVCLVLETGLRMSEARCLRWAHVRADTVFVVKSKTGRTRQVPLTMLAQAAMAEQRVLTGAFAHVFPARRTCRNKAWFVDRPASACCWCRMLDPVCDEVPAFRALPGKTIGRKWHLLRHAFASRHLQADCPLPKIQGWLGHASITTTMMYARYLPGYDADIELAPPPPM